MPDEKGRAWFDLPLDGSWKFIYTDGAQVRGKTVLEKYKPLDQQPGFGYIDRLALE